MSYLLKWAEHKINNGLDDDDNNNNSSSNLLFSSCSSALGEYLALVSEQNTQLKDTLLGTCVCACVRERERESVCLCLCVCRHKTHRDNEQICREIMMTKHPKAGENKQRRINRRKGWHPTSLLRRKVEKKKKKRAEHRGVRQSKLHSQEGCFCSSSLSADDSKAAALPRKVSQARLAQRRFTCYSGGDVGINRGAWFPRPCARAAGQWNIGLEKGREIRWGGFWEWGWGREGENERERESLR